MRAALLMLVCTSACAPAGMLPEVALGGLARQPSIAVEDISDGDGMSDSAALAEELEDTELFDRVERVAVVDEAELSVRGTLDRTCANVGFPDEMIPVTFGFFAVGGVAGTLASIPQFSVGDAGLSLLTYALALAASSAATIGFMAAHNGRYRCSVASDLTVFRRGRPWRRYREQGVIELAEHPSSDAMMRIVARRFAARLARDAETEEVRP